MDSTPQDHLMNYFSSAPVDISSRHECADASLDDYALELECILEDDSGPCTSTSSSDITPLGAGLHCHVQQRSSDASTVSESGIELERAQLVGEEPLVVGQSFHPSPMNIAAPWKAKGVTHHKKNRQWEAHVWVKERQLPNRKKKGEQIFLGSFGTQGEAMVAHDLAALKLQVGMHSQGGKPYPLNFPEASHAAFLAEHREWSTRDFVWKLRRTSNKFSKGRCSLKGVTPRMKARAQVVYEAKISHTLHHGQKWTFDLGKFACEKDAGRAYDLALLFFKGDHSDCVTNFRPSSYTTAEIEAVGQKLRSEIMDSSD